MVQCFLREERSQLTLLVSLDFEVTPSQRYNRVASEMAVDIALISEAARFKPVTTATTHSRHCLVEQFIREQERAGNQLFRSRRRLRHARLRV